MKSVQGSWWRTFNNSSESSFASQEVSWTYPNEPDRRLGDLVSKAPTLSALQTHHSVSAKENYRTKAVVYSTVSSNGFASRWRRRKRKREMKKTSRQLQQEIRILDVTSYKLHRHFMFSTRHLQNQATIDSWVCRGHFSGVSENKNGFQINNKVIMIKSYFSPVKNGFQGAKPWLA